MGVCIIPFTASLLVQTTSSKLPLFNDTVTGSVDPDFKVSKKYPTIGYITGKTNLTIHFIPSLTFDETLSFWTTYQNAIGILSGGVVGAFSTFLVDYLKSRKEHK